MGARSRLLPLLALAGFLPGHAAAQAAAILVRDGTGGPPVAGAIVRLLRGDSVLAQGLTGETGRVTLRAPSAGRYFLQVSRIGYVPGARTPVDLVSAETRSVDLPVLTPKILLPEIIVEAKAQCGKVTAEGALAATLLYQVRQALTATSLSERRGLTLNSRDIDRTLSAGGAVLEERPRSPRLTGSRPFVPAPPEVLAEQGYVRAEADSVVYSAPDADLLLSDPFVETHCFGVRSGPLHDSLTVGLTFEPVKRRRVADIRGVLWVDRRTLELRTLEFRYVSSAQRVLESSAEGRMEFDRLSSGAWYIRNWIIRMPEIVRTELGSTSRDVVVGFREHGGSAESLDASPQETAPARVSGRVIDSLGGGGLAGVVVTVAGASGRAVTDALGEYSLAVPVTGARLVTFTHPLLDSLHTRRVVTLAPGATVTASTSTPGPEAMLRAQCPRDRGRAGLMGRAITETGRPAGQVYVRAEWSRIEGAGAVRHDQMAIATDAGLWSFCDLPPGAAIALRVGARRGADPSATVELAEGRFPWLTLVAREADVGTVAGTDSGQRLPELKTTGRIPVPASERFLTELRERMRRNGAPASALISRAELEKSNTFRLANVLLIHGLKSRVNKNGKQTLTCPHRAERPAVYVDGLLVDGSDSPNAKRFRVGLLSEMFDMENLSLDEVEAVEVYRSPAEWPPEFGRTEAPCVVVIWTRRGVKP